MEVNITTKGWLMKRNYSKKLITDFNPCLSVDSATDVLTLTLSGLSKALLPIKQYREVLMEYLLGEQYTTRYLATGLLGKAISILRYLHSYTYQYIYLH